MSAPSNARPSDESNALTVGKLLSSFAGAAVLSPIKTAGTLVLLGYEPYEEVAGVSIFGSRGFRRPGLYSYLRALYKTQGFQGLFIGAVPNALQAVVSAVLNATVRPVLEPYFIKPTDDVKSLRTVARGVMLDITMASLTTIATQPLRVIYTRMVASVVGDEAAYSTLLSATKTVAAEGLSGLFHGLQSRLVYETARTVVLSALLIAIRRSGVLNIVLSVTQIQSSNNKENAVDPIALQNLYEGYAASSLGAMIYHPLDVVSTIMVINKTDLALAKAPYNVPFDSWFDCLKFYYRLGGWFNKRGLARTLTMARFFKTTEPTTVVQKLLNLPA